MQKSHYNYLISILILIHSLIDCEYTSININQAFVNRTITPTHLYPCLGGFKINSSSLPICLSDSKKVIKKHHKLPNRSHKNFLNPTKNRFQGKLMRSIASFRFSTRKNGTIHVRMWTVTHRAYFGARPTEYSLVFTLYAIKRVLYSLEISSNPQTDPM